MDAKTLSNLELLELIIGKRAAQRSRGSRLSALFRDDSGHELLHIARELVERMLIEDMVAGIVVASPANVLEYLRLHFKLYESEAFVAIFLDARHQVIRSIEMFRGTVTGAAIYPREIVKEAMKQNAAAIIVAHNHPSGVAEPSAADREITERIRCALALVEVRLLDHIVVGGLDTVSFAERGWC